MSESTPTDYSKRIEATLFEIASGLTDAEEQRAFLDRTCYGDPALRKRLDGLLSLKEEAEQFFKIPSLKMPAGVSRLAVLEGENGLTDDSAANLVGGGATIGHFKLLGRIGEGGCGVVYRAEQLEPVNREVALKIIRLGMDTEAVIARFELERQALAMMEHPNIARVLDAGTTTDGRPFFVMEFVDGAKITDFCNRHQYTVRQRLEVFVQVCGAIQHAHQKGIIHRDIKPSNVLVYQFDGEPLPKVIDFGVAKATRASRDDDGTSTVAGQFLGTLAYTSPEQACGESDVDTRTDIYSLGALLYELVCGRPAFDPKALKDVTIEEARRIVSEVEPPAPSTILEGGRIRELNWIVMKAMSKERQLRYETANGLAADVRRFLENEPVLAGPPKRMYRLAKLVRRNRVTFLSGSVAVLALLTGLAVSTRLYYREKQAREDQARLRVVAEEALRNEARLREAGEYRSLVSQAAVLIHYQDLEGADRLLSAIPVSETPSSLEAANAFDIVGHWHLQAGRLHKAARNYSSVVRAISDVDDSDNDSVSRNLLMASALTSFVKDENAYGQVRELAIERFAGTSHPVVAEQVLKACLLRPADEEMLSRLRPLGTVLETAFETEGSIVNQSSHFAAWSCFSMALMKYRDGENEAASSWAERCLQNKRKNPAREASAQIILSMASHRLGNTDSANAFLEQASEPVLKNSETSLTFGNDNTGSWHSWLTAGALLREAKSLRGRSISGQLR